jgi:hypothetical protein
MCNTFLLVSMRESVNRSQMEVKQLIDVIGFLCVSLGNSTVQLHDSLGTRRACACSEAVFSSQNVDRGIYYRRAALCCVFSCGQKDSIQRIFIEKCFLFTVGSLCRVKRFTTGWKTFRWWRGWTGGAEVAETTVKETFMLRVSTHW